MTGLTLRLFRTALLLALQTAFLQVASADCTKDCGTISMGQPKLWSLSDAQYLIGNMREQLRNVIVALPNDPAQPQKGAIDPNAINLRQLDTLIQSLSVQAQYNQADQATNRQADQKYQLDVAEYKKNLAEQDQLNLLIAQKQQEQASLGTDVTSFTAQLTTFDGQITNTQTEPTDRYGSAQ